MLPAQPTFPVRSRNFSIPRGLGKADLHSTAARFGTTAQARGEHPRELLSSPIPPPLKIHDWVFKVHGQVLTNPRRTRICTVTTKLQQCTDNHGELLGRGGTCPTVRSICDMLRPVLHPSKYKFWLLDKLSSWTIFLYATPFQQSRVFDQRSSALEESSCCRHGDREVEMTRRAQICTRAAARACVSHDLARHLPTCLTPNTIPPHRPPQPATPHPALFAASCTCQ